jgi:iron(III) transport system ATP-binding protein
VAMGRALVRNPALFLFDEPLSNLDAKLRQQLRSELKQLQADVGITTVYVTHDQDEALTMSDRIAVFNQGRVEQVGTPQEIYDRSATEFVCTFIGDCSRLSPQLVERLDSADAPRLDPSRRSYLRVEKPAMAAGHVEVPARTGDGVTVLGTVTTRSYHGLHSRYTVESHGSQLKVIVKEGQGREPQIGDAVHVTINPAHVLQYAEAR